MANSLNPQKKKKKNTFVQGVRQRYDTISRDNRKRHVYKVMYILYIIIHIVRTWFFKFFISFSAENVFH